MGIKKSGERGASAGSAQGFTLVELAIVLVIIGIIIGAVMKGQDLIDNARAKKFISTIRTWEVFSWSFMDRKGRFPGDGIPPLAPDGVIGNVPSEVATADTAIGEMTDPGIFANAPLNPISVGSYSFWIYIGYDAPGGTTKNVIVICKTVGCTAGTFFTADELKMIESIDTAIDGLSDAGLGQFRAATAVTLAGAGTANNRATAAVTAVTAVSETTAGATALWNTTTHLAGVWLFDKPY